MPIEVPAHVREAHERAANEMLKSIEQVRTTLGINRGRTSFHDMRFHFWREEKEIRESNKEAQDMFDAFRKRHVGVMGAKTSEQWLKTSDAEVRSLAGLTNLQREELLSLLQALVATGGYQPLEAETREKALKERRTKILSGDMVVFQDTLELDLLYRLQHASQVRENVTGQSFNVLADLNQRRLLSHVQHALIDDFLTMAENYANHLRQHALTLPETVRNQEHEKRLRGLLTNMLAVGPQAAAVYRAIFTENWLQQQQRWQKQMQDAQKRGGTELKALQDALSAQDPPMTLENAMKNANVDIEILHKNLKQLRQNLTQHERDVPCREEVADTDLESFFSQARRRLGNGVPEFERGANPKRKRELLEQYKKVLMAQMPHITDVQITTRETPQGLRWRITKTIRLSSAAPAGALEEIYGELSRNILDTANVSVMYQARNLTIVGATMEYIRAQAGVGFPGPSVGREVPVRLGHVMYSNLLLAHTQHATTNMGPSTADAGRKEKIDKVMEALTLSGQLGTAWRQYGNSSMSLLSRYEGLLAARGHFGPYFADMGGGFQGLHPDQLQHYISRPLPVSIRAALSGGDFTVTREALQQYMYIIRNDFAPRLQWITLMNDGLEQLNKFLEPLDEGWNTAILISTTLPAWYTNRLGEMGITLPAIAGTPQAAKERVDAYEAFRKTVLERRERFQDALKTVRERQAQMIKAMERIDAADKRLRELLVFAPPEHLLEGAEQRAKMGEEQCAKYRKTYVEIIQELENAQSDFASIIGQTDQDLDEIINVRSLRSFQYGNLGAMGWQECTGIAVGAWWTLGFPMGKLGRLPVVRHMRKFLNPLLFFLDRADNSIANTMQSGVNRVVGGTGRLLRGAGRIGRDITVIRPDVNRLLAELGRTNNVTVASFQKVLAAVSESRQPEVLERLIRNGNLSTSQRQLIASALNGNPQMINLVRANEALRILGIPTLTAQQQSLEILSVLRAVPPGRDYIQLVNILLENRTLSPSQRMFFNALIHEGNAAMELTARSALGAQILQPVLGEILINQQALEAIIKAAHATEQEALRIAYNNLRADYDALRSAIQTGNQAAIQSAQSALHTSEQAVKKILEEKTKAIVGMLRAPGVGLPGRLAEQCANRLVRSGVCGLESAAANANGLGLLAQEAPRAAVPVLRTAATRSAIVTNAITYPRQANAVSGASRFMRMGGRIFFVSGAILGSAYLEEIDTKRRAAHAEQCRKALEADLRASFPTDLFEHKDGNIYVHKISGVRFDVSVLRKTVADNAQFINTSATLHRGGTLLTAATLIIPKIGPQALALIAITGIIDVINDYKAGQRNMRLRALFRDTPTDVLAMVDMSHLSGMGYGGLMKELGEKVMISEGGTANGWPRVLEAMNKYQQCFLMREVTMFCAEQRIPVQVLTSSNESLSDVIRKNSHDRDFNFRVSQYDTRRGRDYIRADMQTFVTRLMAISLLHKRAQLQRHEHPQNGSDRLTATVEQRLRAEISFLEHQYGGPGQSIADAIDEHSSQQRVPEYLEKPPDNLRVRDMHIFPHRWEIIWPHENTDRVYVQSKDMLLRLGAARVITRVRHNKRESIPIDRSEAAEWRGTNALRIILGGQMLYFAMIGGRLMWSSENAPQWQKIDRGRYRDAPAGSINAQANALTDFLTRLWRDTNEDRQEYTSLESEGIRILLYAGATRTRISPFGTQIQRTENAEMPAGSLEAFSLEKREGSTVHRATFVWGGVDWYWFSPESPQWQKASAAESANPIVTVVAPQIARSREIERLDAAGRVELAQDITRSGMLHASSMTSGALRDPELQEELFYGREDAPDIYVFPSYLDRSNPSIEWARREPYNDLIATMADELAPIPPGGSHTPNEIRPQIIQIRRAYTQSNNQSYETVLLTAICAVGNASNPTDPLAFRNLRHIAATRRVTNPQGIFRLGAAFTPVQSVDPVGQAWQKEAASLLKARSGEQVKSAETIIKELESKANKEMQEIGKKTALAYDQILEKVAKMRSENPDNPELKKLIAEAERINAYNEKAQAEIRNNLEKSKKELRGRQAGNS